MKAGAIRIGIGGWSFEPWRETFYPEGLPQRRELDYASRRLTSIEVNATYYRSQKPETFANWRDETPDEFVFSLKAPRFATNRRKLAEAGASIERFLASGLSALGPKLGPIDWQFMPTKAFDAEDFEAFLALLPPSLEGLPLRHAVEPRHPSFQTAEFVALARQYGVAIVVAGDSPYPQIADPTAPFVYARLMGSTENEPLGYAPARLDLWAQRAKSWAKGGCPDGLDYVGATPRGKARDVYLYVISGAKAHNPAAAMALIERLR